MVLATIGLNLGEFIERPNGVLSADDVDITLDTGLLGDVWQEACSRNHIREFYPLVSSLESRSYKVFRDTLESIGGTSLVIYQELKGKKVEVSYTAGRLVLDKSLIGVENVPSMLESLVKIPRCTVKGILSKGRFYAVEYIEEGFDFASVVSNLEYLGNLGFEVVPYNTLDIYDGAELDELFLGVVDEDVEESLGLVLKVNDNSVATKFSESGLWLPYKMLSNKVYKGYIQYVSWCEDIDGILRPFAYVADMQDIVKFQDSRGVELGYYDLIQREGFDNIVSKVKNLDELGVRTVGVRVVKYIPLHNIATMLKLNVRYQGVLYFRVYKGLVFPTDEDGKVIFDTFDI